MLQRDDDKLVYTVSELAGSVRFTLEERFPMVWVEGELSNLRAPGSGHWYFTLKDNRAQLRCAMFANRNRFVRFKPRDGMTVILRGRVSLYEARGDFQLLADHLELSGEGALRAAFDALKRTLGDEGLFAETRKRPLPEYPSHLAVISSLHGAALRDVVSVLRRRCPALRVTLLPVSVQGKDAEAQILEALDRVADWPAEFGEEPDAVLLTRGGGSLEDLWAFNLESVARAVAASPIPIVSAIGHETDITICDFVADVRAPTPSSGAELIAPNMREWMRRAARLTLSLHSHWRHTLSARQQRLYQVARRLTHPGRALQQRMQRLDDVERQLIAASKAHIGRARNRATLLQTRLRQFHPRREIAHARTVVRRAEHSLVRAVNARIETAKLGTAAVGRALNAVSPLATLGRGYAIVTTPAPLSERWGTPITSIADTAKGNTVVAHLDDGSLTCVVQDVDPNAD